MKLKFWERKLKKLIKVLFLDVLTLLVDFHAGHSKYTVIRTRIHTCVPKSTPRKNKSKGKYHKKPMYLESKQPSSSLDSLHFYLEGFHILALLIYCCVIMYSSQTWIDTAASLKSICHHSRTQCKIPMNQIQHVFYKIASNPKLFFTWRWQIIRIFLYKILFLFLTA